MPDTCASPASKHQHVVSSNIFQGNEWDVTYEEIYIAYSAKKRAILDMLIIILMASLFDLIDVTVFCHTCALLLYSIDVGKRLTSWPADSEKSTSPLRTLAIIAGCKTRFSGLNIKNIIQHTINNIKCRVVAHMPI